MICENQTKKYCKDDFSKIENYEEAISDTTKTWHLHHRKETIYTRNGLIERGEYYDRPASELIFLPPSQHMALHGTLRQISEDTRKKLSLKFKGFHHWTNGVVNKWAEECPGEGWYLGMKKRGRKIYQKRGCRNTRKYANSPIPELITVVLDDNTPIYERRWICKNYLKGILSYEDVRTKNRRRKTLEKFSASE